MIRKSTILSPLSSIFIFAIAIFFLLALIFTQSILGGNTNKIIEIPSIGYKMVYILPGTFIMGSPVSAKWRQSDELQHKVTIAKGFYLGITEITQGQWCTIMGNNSARFKNCGDNCAVAKVSWEDCQEFIKKLNQKEKIDAYRLPSEAEWEYACRAGTDTPFFFGECLSTDQANYRGNLQLSGCATGKYRGEIIPVRNFPPNAWGLYDMHGNASEWCQDWYGNYPSDSVTDPKGPLSGSHRVCRGGGWNNSAHICRSAYRSLSRPDERNSSLGFRLARISNF